jgi:SAM-dependent methyltransferase
MIKSAESIASAASYEVVANEYYNSERHPTCTNFREASRTVFRNWFNSVPKTAAICEVGAGKSLVAELFAGTNRDLSALTLVDVSPAMLGYSQEWSELGVKLRLASAFSLPFSAESFGVVASCLGDPYNAIPFWVEVHRTLKPNGVCLFTTPSWEWAKAFREASDAASMHSSVFELADGSQVSLPSHIYPEDEQIRLIESAGFIVSEVSHTSFSDLAGQKLSPKLVLSRGANANVVTGYVAKKTKKTAAA